MSWLNQNVNNNIVCANTVTLGLAREGPTRVSPGNKPQLRFEVLSNGLTIVYMKGTVLHDPTVGTGRFSAGTVLWQLPPEYTPTSKLFFITYGTPQAAPGESGGLTIEGTDGAAADVGKFTKQMVGPDCGLESCFYFIEEA